MVMRYSDFLDQPEDLPMESVAQTNFSGDIMRAAAFAMTGKTHHEPVTEITSSGYATCLMSGAPYKTMGDDYYEGQRKNLESLSAEQKRLARKEDFVTYEQLTNADEALTSQAVGRYSRRPKEEYDEAKVDKAKQSGFANNNAPVLVASNNTTAAASKRHALFGGDAEGDDEANPWLSTTKATIKDPRKTNKRGLVGNFVGTGVGSIDPSGYTRGNQCTAGFPDLDKEEEEKMDISHLPPTLQMIARKKNPGLFK
jgi:hypothetical protein